MSNKKITLFVITMMLLIIGISAVTAIDNQTIDSTKAIDNTVKESSVNSEIYSDESSDNIDESITNKDIQKEEKNVKTDKTIVITNRTFNTYFNNEYLTDEVSAGDTLDFQGSFLGEEFSMIIDKPVNIITSTNNAYICTNTSSGDLSGAKPVTSFTILNGGSYTNVTGIYFYNTQIFIKNASHVTINNISAIVEDRAVGSGVGQTAIRDNSSYVIIENSTISTKNNGGSTSIALSWVNNCIVRNNKIIGIGNVGNLFYLNTFNVDNLPRNENGQIDYSIVNVNNLIENNILIGPDTPTSICYGMCLSGMNNTIRNNTINYTGMGVNNMDGLHDYDTNTIITNNTFNGCNFNVPQGSTVTNNIITGYLNPNEKSILENNTIKEVRLKDNTKISDNIIGNILLNAKIVNVTIENCTITDNITLKGSSRTNVPTNITINNNQISGIIYLNGTNTLTVSDNNITGQIIISNRARYNQNININNNNISTDEDYAIIVNTTVDKLNISNNALKSDNNTDTENIHVNPANDAYIIEDNTVIEDEVEIILIINDVIVPDTIIVNRSSQIRVNVTNDAEEEVDGTITITDGQVTVTSNEKTLTYTPTSSGDKELTVTFTNGKESVTTSIKITVKPIELVVDEINARVNQKINITARIIAVNETLTEINKGKVVFKVNGKTLKDDSGKVIYAKVVNGIATIENYIVPQSWNKAVITIEAVYSGSTQQNALRSQKQDMTITPLEPTIITEDVTAKIADTITLKATVNDNGNQLGSSKVIFKINGKSIKDTSGKVIYVQLTDNIASIEYTIPSTYKAKSYTLTAVLITPEYNRLEDTKTLTITE